MSTSAIYYQKSAVVQEEFKLIEMATLREMTTDKLQKVIREVKELRRVCDEAAMLETVILFNKARDATVDLIRSISIWQESFTSPIRPRILDCDYIIDRMIYHIDFINSTKLKRVFNFQFYRGNVLLLPYPNPKSADPVRISSALGRELRQFAAPPEETVVFCYQFLINCLPEDIYKDKLAPLKRWLMAGWIPRVYVTVDKAPPVEKSIASAALTPIPPKPVRTRLHIATAPPSDPIPEPAPAPLVLAPPPAAEPAPEPAAEVTPADNTNVADGDDTPASRKFLRRESRRVSDLTVTFSVHGGVGADTDSVFEEVTVAPMRPFNTKAHKSSNSRHNSPQRVVRPTSPKRTAATGRRAPQSPSTDAEPIRSRKLSDVTSTSGKFNSSSPTSARSSRSVVSSTNEYGIKKKAGTPPRASETLSLSTEAMRSWFAAQEEVELGVIH